MYSYDRTAARGDIFAWQYHETSVALWTTMVPRVAATTFVQDVEGLISQLDRERDKIEKDLRSVGVKAAEVGVTMIGIPQKELIHAQFNVRFRSVEDLETLKAYYGGHLPAPVVKPPSY